MNTVLFERTPKRVQVSTDELTLPYWGVSDSAGRLVYAGNVEQVHSWLGQHNYVSTGHPSEYVRLGQ